ncbi:MULTISPECIES: LacI family DNA-binding transcriptional regulator [Sphingomonas]|uniref:LacI family DNA-binding transcriptional regulator n=1 Tax=Sphingomonas TaxID=13687 RepID=UPI002238934A|nr:MULTISPECIES: LacI family DNA-binding transcriptional regulator [Sphingomonas]
MGDIARLANVSKPTVSRVLNNSPLVNDETRERVLRVARENGYAINRNAQKLRQTRNDTIAVVLDLASHRAGRVADPFIFELLAGVSEALSVRNQDLLLSPPNLSDAQSHVDLISSRVADGFIFLGQGVRGRMLRDLARAGAPFVVWGGVDPADPYCAVGSDNHLGGRLAGELFVRRGAKRWLFVGNIAHSEINMRFEGLREIAAKHREVSVEHLAAEQMAYAPIFQSAAQWLRGNHQPPDAVFAFSDTAAMAIIAAFREAGLEAPRDYSLCGYNNIPPAAHFTPAITTIEQETHLAGALLVEKLMQMLEGGKPKSSILPTRLIVRQT